MRPGDLSYSYSLCPCPVADAVRSLNPLAGAVHRQQPAGGRRRSFRFSFCRTYDRTYDRTYGYVYYYDYVYDYDYDYDYGYDRFYDRPPRDLIPGPLSGSGPRGGAHALLACPT